MTETLRDVMSTKLEILSPQNSVEEGAHTMRERDIGNVLLQDRDGALCGIVTDRDLVVRCLAEGRDARATKLSDLCTKSVLTLSQDAPVAEAVKIMSKEAVRRIPVVDGEQPVGIVSLGDLAVFVERDSALGQISAAQANR